MSCKRQLCLFLLLFCTACAPFQRLPPPDPAWAAVFGTDKPDLRNDHPHGANDAATATQRARSYVESLSTSSALVFAYKLEEQKFSCDIDASGKNYDCIYDVARPPIPCVVPYHVLIDVSFPYGSNATAHAEGTLLSSDLSVAALGIYDSTLHDDTGCFPL